MKFNKIIFKGLIISFLFIVISFSLFTKVSHAADSYSFNAFPGKDPGTITISWYDDTTANQYDVRYGLSMNNMQFGQTAMPDTKNANNSYTIRYLTPGATYYIQLVAETGNNPTILGPISVKATSGSLPISKPAIIPSAVSQYNLSASPGAEPGTIKIIWSDDGNTDNYDLIYGNSLDQMSFGSYHIGFIKGAKNNYIISSLTPGQTYYLELIAESGGNNITAGPISTQATSGIIKTTPIKITSGPIGQYKFLATSNTSGAVKVSWSDDGSADQYNIIYGPYPNQYFWGSFNVGFSPHSQNSTIIKALNSGTTYYFALVAEKDGNIIYTSAPISIITH